MTGYHVVIQLTAHGEMPMPESAFEDLMDQLLEIERQDDEIVDPDLAGSLASGRLDIQMTVEASDPAKAGTKALCAVRTALHTIGGATPGWELADSRLRVSPSKVLADA